MSSPCASTVLIVEDDVDIRELLRELLEDQGFAVLCAEHGTAALSVLRSTATRPKLILLDLSMPVMDGFAFRSAQLADPSLADVPVLVMTAAGDVPRMDQLLAADALKKPMSMQSVLEAVRRHTQAMAPPTLMSSSTAAGDGGAPAADPLPGRDASPADTPAVTAGS